VHSLSASKAGNTALRAWTTLLDSEPAAPAPPAAGDSVSMSTHGFPDAGVRAPFGVKDVIDVAGFPTRAGSRALEHAPICRQDALAVSRLRAMGLVPIGKTVTTEFAYVDPAETGNPFDHRRTPGGSSSGSAAAVGAGQVPLALGTQTAGSVCRPAAFCGTYAFKPSTGRTPAEGLTPFAPSFDTIGTMGLRLDWTIAAALTILGDDIAAGRSLVPSPTASPLRIGICSDSYFTAIAQGAQAELDRGASILAEAGHSIHPIRIGLEFPTLRIVHRRIMQHEAHRAHGALLSSRPDLLGPAWRGALIEGSRIADLDYRADLLLIAQARRTILEAIDSVDCVLLPPAYDEAPEGLSTTGDAGLIIPWTYARTPLMVLPTGLSPRGLPLAVMVAGKPDDDRGAAAMGLAIAGLLEANGMSIDHPRSDRGRGR
jgi:aspartyl-tRNA(Asn)/glutamyl-tRNA(Gln) amidotransferase subunit A